MNFSFSPATAGSALVLASGLLLSACQTAPSPQSQAISNIETLAVSPVIREAETGWRLGRSVLSLHPSRGILLNGVVISDGPGSAEYGDRRADAFLTFDSASQSLVLFRADETGVSTVQTSAPLSYALEGLCLYQPEGEPLQAFVLGEDQLARQLILRGEGEQLSLQPVRTLPLPPGTEYCAVSDVMQTLFISEEGIGVWSMPASAEKEPVREAVDMASPWGQLTGGPGPLAINGDHLLVAGVGTAQLQSYRMDSSGFILTRHWQLPADTAIETVTVSPGADAVALLLFDDNSSTLIGASLPTPPALNLPAPLPVVKAVVETTPVATDGDAADDPAIWVNLSNPEASRILGTNKKSGLAVYNLKGEQLQFLDAGRVNNVDVRQNFSLNRTPMDIAAASQRDRQAISLFAIDPQSGEVSPAGEIAITLDNVYGLCMYMSRAQQAYVFINDEDGRFQQYRISSSEDGWNGTLVREFAVETQPEGCVADDLSGILYLGEENRAVWTIPAMPDTTTTPQLMVPVSDALVADIEGMGLYREDGRTLLVVSSQGNDSYVVYDTAAPYPMLGRFRVGMNAAAGIDGASETDGLEVTSMMLGEDFPRGLLVVQDGRNVMPAEHQNFKLISWEEIAPLLTQSSR